MVIYYNQDAKTDFSGDITVAGNGDIQLATTTETMMQQAAFRLRTSPSDFAAAVRDVGANLSVFIGQPLSEDLLKDIEDQSLISLTDQLFDKDDIDVVAVPISTEEILIYIETRGLYVDIDGQAETNGFNAVFSFPLYEGDVVQLINYQEL